VRRKVRIIRCLLLFIFFFFLFSPKYGRPMSNGTFIDAIFFSISSVFLLFFIFFLEPASLQTVKERKCTTTLSPIVHPSLWAVLVLSTRKPNVEPSTPNATASRRVLRPLMGRTTTIWTARVSIL